MKTYYALSLLTAWGIFSTNLKGTSRKYSKTNRKPEYHSVDPLLLHRWSPRAMSGQMITQEELMTMFEAARWAPSAANNQSWRFVYAKKGTPEWQRFFDLLDDFNKSWAEGGAVLIMIFSKTIFDYNGEPSRTHSFEAGAAFQNFALQGSILGLVVHAMKGFDYDKARELLKVPDEYSVEAMIVVGRQGDPDKLPSLLQKFESPSNRKPLADIVREGKFDF